MLSTGISGWAMLLTVLWRHQMGDGYSLPIAEIRPSALSTQSLIRTTPLCSICPTSYPQSWQSLPVGNAASRLVLIPTRPHLYVAYKGTSSETDPGGVAIVHVFETTCEDLFKRALHECSDCDDDDECVVLATIKGYTSGAAITD